MPERWKELAGKIRQEVLTKGTYYEPMGAVAALVIEFALEGSLMFGTGLEQKTDLLRTLGNQRFEKLDRDGDGLDPFEITWRLGYLLGSLIDTMGPEQETDDAGNEHDNERGPAGPVKH